MKAFSLGLLIFMNTAQVIFMRYARTYSTEKYESTTAVVLGEVMKIFMSFFLMMNDQGSVRKTITTISRQASENKREVILQAVPALLYTMQNVFRYVAISNLDAGIFQICTRMKILITALLSVIFLGKKLRLQQWISLFILVGGIILINDKKKTAVVTTDMNFTVGFIAVIISSTASGLAGVFMEKMFKDKRLSVWNRNFWLAVWSAVVGMITLLSKDVHFIYPSVFFKNYNVWAIVAQFLLAIGGLVIGLVLKYADNILKAFAGSASILFSTIISVYLVGTSLSSRVVVGGCLVMFAVVLYSYAPKKVEYHSLSPIENTEKPPIV